ncbi:MAG TPA: hypothetical protein VHO25_05060 [Polyangiaceae bacterium]|nr:hypothetical protein [Polyangiaceae bacterium]
MRPTCQSYDVEVERDPGGNAWTASWYADGGGGVVAQGRTLARTLLRFRSALALHLDDREAATRAVLVPILVGIPRALVDRVVEARVVRQQADALQERASEAIRKVASALSKRGLSARDVGTLIGVSRQRAHKLLGN